MPQCCVPRCLNRSEFKKTKPLSFYRFPCDEREKKKWVQLIRRKDFTPNCNSRVCSWHFPNGKAAGPQRFAWNEGETFEPPDPPSHSPKQEEQTVPVCVKEETTDEPVNADVAPAPTPSASRSLVLLEIENDMLRRENEELKKQLAKQKQIFSFSQISSNPDRVQYFTGLPDAATVVSLEARLSKFELQYHSEWNVQSMPLIDQLLLTLMKLKLNCGHIDLATRFNCSTATVTNIFTTIVSALYDILYVGMYENNIPSTARSQASLPDCNQPSPSCRMGPDGAEATPTPPIGEDVSPNSPSLPVNGQFTQEETNINRLISSAKIHAGHSTQRLNAFSILHHIPHQFKTNIDKILKVCECLANLKNINSLLN